MKRSLIIALMAVTGWAYAADKAEEWNETTLSEETIEKIQQAQLSYKKCAIDAMHKAEYAKLESRRATDAVIKDCEPVLADMRQVYVEVEVPAPVADRHLKKLRIDVTRKVLQELMYIEAAKQAGAQP